MKIVHIPLLREPGVMFSAGKHGLKLKYDVKFVEEQLRKIDKNVYLYTDYCDTMSSKSPEASLYMMKIFTDNILESVYKNKHYSEDPILRMKKYDADTNTILCTIDDNTDMGKKLIDTINNDKVYITFILIYDDDYHSITIERATLCLGTVGHHILFI